MFCVRFRWTSLSFWATLLAVATSYTWMRLAHDYNELPVRLIDGRLYSWKLGSEFALGFFGSDETIPPVWREWLKRSASHGGDFITAFSEYSVRDIGVSMTVVPCDQSASRRDAVILVISLWYVDVILIACIAMSMIAPVRKLRRRFAARGRCAKCRYDLRGLTSSRCPECGEPFELHTPA